MQWLRLEMYNFSSPGNSRTCAAKLEKFSHQSDRYAIALACMAPSAGRSRFAFNQKRNLEVAYSGFTCCSKSGTRKSMLALPRIEYPPSLRKPGAHSVGMS